MQGERELSILDREVLREVRKLLGSEPTKVSTVDSVDGESSTETIMAKRKRKKTEAVARGNRYGDVLASVVDLLDFADAVGEI